MPGNDIAEACGSPVDTAAVAYHTSASPTVEDVGDARCDYGGALGARRCALDRPQLVQAVGGVGLRQDEGSWSVVRYPEPASISMGVEVARK